MVKSSASLLQERALSEAPHLLPKLEALKDFFAKKILSAPDVCVSYILITLSLRHGPERTVSGIRQPNESFVEVSHESPYDSASLGDLQVQQILGCDVISDRALARLHLHRESATVRDFWMKAHLHKIPDHVALCIDSFYFGLRPLRLMFRIPSPEELLAMQAEGSRCVSALISSKMLTQIFGHRDCLEMLLHDLAHMEKFVEAGRFWQQVGFFSFLHASVAPLHLKWREVLGKRWELSWHYVSADMNAVANHMLMTLKAQLMVAMARKTLLDAGIPRIPTEVTEDELEAVKADVYPRASMAEWKPSLADAGLLSQFEESFRREWEHVLGAHVRHAEDNFPGVFEDGNAEGLADSVVHQASFDLWPRPSADEFVRAATCNDPLPALALAVALQIL